MEPHEQLRQMIERFAPAFTKDARDLFYPELRESVSQISIPTHASDKILDSYTYALTLILIAYLRSESADALKQHGSRADHIRSIAKLSKEQAKILRTLKGLEKDPNIRFIDYEFYDPTEVHCPHERSRKECERLAAARRSLLLLDQPPLNRNIGGHLAELKEKHRHLLKQRPSDFCEPRALPPAPLPIIREGQPKNELAEFMTKELVGWLQADGWKVIDAVRFLEEILRLFFGVTYGIDTLRKRWYRLKPPATDRHPSKPSGS